MPLDKRRDGIKVGRWSDDAAQFVASCVGEDDGDDVTMTDANQGAWRMTVEGGPAFMENATQALQHAADQYHDGSPTSEVFRRLAAACACAERVE